VKIRKRRERMSAERFLTRLVSQVLCDLATRTCEGMHRNGVAIIEEKRECSSEMSARDLRLVQLHPHLSYESSDFTTNASPPAPRCLRAPLHRRLPPSSSF